MDNTSLRLELVPMDEAASADAPTPSAPEKSSATTPTASDVVTAAEAALDAIEIRAVDRPVPTRTGPGVVDAFVEQASREYAQGHLDKPLWDRAMKQAEGDAATAAPMYITARAIALRIFDRKRRGQKRQVEEPEDDAPAAPSGGGIWPRYRVAIIAAAVIVPAAIAGVVLMTAPEPAPQVAVAAAARPSPAAPVAPAAPAAQKSDQSGAALAKKVQELRDAGNYNVMVLYAVEWTRKEPTNPAAWDELRAGYQYLRQSEDARMAANKAVQLAPDDARLWRHLATINMDLDDPERALAAFDHAAALNSADVDSLHAIALLNTRLGRPQEAKGAFDRAAAASPGDPITACLRNGVAQMPPPRDAYTMTRQVRAIDNRCHGKADAVAAAR